MRSIICVLIGLDTIASARAGRVSSRPFGGAGDAKLSLSKLKSFLLQLNPSVATRNYAARSRTGPARMYESYSAAFGVGNADSNFWYIFPRDVDNERGRNEDMSKAKYMVGLGQEQTLGYHDYTPRKGLSFPPEHPFHAARESVADEQCAVQIAADGAQATLFALGTEPTGYRFSPQEPWKWLQPGESAVMPHYGKISLFHAFPEEMVFKLGDGYMLQQEEALMLGQPVANEQPGYQQQPAYQQQPGYQQQPAYQPDYQQQPSY